MDHNHFVCHTTQRPGGCHHRLRLCLLKGCERQFRPQRPQARYCSSSCQAAARFWRRRQASQTYRTSNHGKEQRREQSKRYRERVRERAAASADVEPSREGQRPASGADNFARRRCARPGCYELFPIKHEHSCKRFCSVACRLALRRVLDRETRYQSRRMPMRCDRVNRPARPPNMS